MNCEDYTELISASLDGELTPEERSRLDAHLSRCPDCRALMDELTDMEARLQELSEEPPAGFTDRVMEAVRREARPARRRVPYWKKLLPAAAVFALVVAGATALPNWNDALVADFEESAPAVSSRQTLPDGEAGDDAAPQQQVAAYQTQTENDESRPKEQTREDGGVMPEAGLLSVDALSVQQALELTVERVSADSGYERTLTYEENSCRIVLTDKDTVVDESTVTYTGLSENGKYYLFCWSWDGQSSEEQELYRYAVSVEDGSVIWRGESAPDTDGFDLMLTQ